MNDTSKLYRCIESGNGEIRIQAARYEAGWYCIIAIIEVCDNVWEKFEDLVGGDLEYFDSRDFFLARGEDFVLVRADSPSKAMKDAVYAASKKLSSA